jgi:CDP-L-myo-inositol myo-inositolphosphotransferase
MKVVILASGKGERIRDKYLSPKPLISLLGLSLIERVILTAKDAGFRDFLIVVGYEKEKIKEKLKDGKEYGVEINYVDNDEWEKENGVSLLKASSFLKEKFILLMSDHIFDKEILELLRKNEEKECLLCIDKNFPRYIDLEDATKAKLEDDYIKDIGKNLKDYDALDTGIFLLSPLVFDALKESIKNQNTTLSGAIKILTKDKKIKGLDIKGKFWIDIDTEKELKIAKKILLKKLTKTTDGFVSRYLNRPISTKITKVLLNYPFFTPNKVSFISFLIATLSAAVFSLGNYISFLIGGILTQISSILDGCDGEIAKCKFKVSEYGAWFDACLDRYADAFIILGISLGLWKISFNIGVWIISFFVLIGSFMNSYTASKYDAIFTKEGKSPKIRIGRDLRYFLIMLGAVLNKLLPTLVFLAIITNIESIRRLFVLRKIEK